MNCTKPQQPRLNPPRNTAVIDRDTPTALAYPAHRCLRACASADHSHAEQLLHASRVRRQTGRSDPNRRARIAVASRRCEAASNDVRREWLS